jgi:hypothetical protein
LSYHAAVSLQNGNEEAPFAGRAFSPGLLQGDSRMVAQAGTDSESAALFLAHHQCHRLPTVDE